MIKEAGLKQSLRIIVTVHGFDFQQDTRLFVVKNLIVGNYVCTKSVFATLYHVAEKVVW